MRWLNLIANLVIIAWIGTWVAEPGMLLFDLIGLVSWCGITAFEMERDFGGAR